MTKHDLPDQAAKGLSIIHGVPLSEEPGLGTLTLPAYLREVTQQYGPREALVMHHPDGSVERWSYDELWARAMAVARALVANGVGKDTRVGVLMTNRPEWLSAVFGVALAGGVATTLSTFSTPVELEQLIQMSGISTLLFERNVLKKDFAAILNDLEPQIAQAKPGELASLKFPHLRRLAMVGEGASQGALETWSDFLAHGQAIAPEHVEAIASTTLPADSAVLFFSSGSTGKAKGILSSHRGVTVQCWRWKRIYQLQDDVRCWSANGFFWSGNFCMALGATLTSGGSLVLQPTFEPAEALRLMAAEKVTLLVAWPHQWAQLKAQPTWESTDLSSVRYVDVELQQLGSNPTLTTKWREPRWAYGNTETFTITTIFPANTPEEIAGASHGEPLPGNTIRIIDPLSGETVPMGERGEITVKGPTLMLGYIGIPLDETLDAEGFLRTGDGGYIDDKGRLVWEGRLNDIIKTGGANVSPIEVDGVLATFPGIKVNMTVGVPHETLGEMVVSCVVPKAGVELSEAAIRDFLKERLASYKIPRRVLFVQEADLALTGSSKVKSGALRELAAKLLAAEA
ncbi:AMP-binding protein [Phenylobacterium sp. LjRoot219]|uniref:class I adenylate-forming enzyme family protein n=1 Tax=Phenylobacterium sp. LjRoot219 TaxID=3342283 RepID=UPI003ED0455B